MLTYSIISKIGNRSVNEDAVGYCERKGANCFIVCDGLGGHGMGDVASNLVKDVFIEQFNQQNSLEEFIPDSFNIAQEELIRRQHIQNVNNKMRTTAVVLTTNEKMAYIGHIGDSRMYVFENDSVKLRTRDHSVAQILALSGEITDKEIRKHPERNVLLRAMGTEWDKPMYEIMPPLKMKSCQAFLLCSDGFWEHIHEDRMCTLLKKASTVEQWLEAMVVEIVSNGKNNSMDNYSAIAVWNKKYKHK